MQFYDPAEITQWLPGSKLLTTLSFSMATTVTAARSSTGWGVMRSRESELKPTGR